MQYKQRITLLPLDITGLFGISFVFVLVGFLDDDMRSEKFLLLMMRWKIFFVQRALRSKFQQRTLACHSPVRHQRLHQANQEQDSITRLRFGLLVR
jgi:hypothetical protein